MSNPWQPTLQGPRVTLRPLLESDFETLFRVASDPKIWEQHPVHNRHERSVFMDFFKSGIESGGALLALDSVSGEVMGSSRYHKHRPEISRVEIGYTFLDRKCWGQGHNPEIKKLMLDHAFQYVNLVEFHIGPKNLRSRKAIEGIGARFSREVPPHVVYEIAKRDWRP